MEIPRGSDDGPEEEQGKGQFPVSEPTHSSVDSSTTLSSWRPGNDDRRITDYRDETPINYVKLNTFEELTAHLKAKRCRMCKEPFFSSELDIRHLFQDWLNGIVDQLSCNIRCDTCGTRSCIACDPEPFTRSSRIISRDSNQCVSWCCVGGRCFLIWVLLCGFDRQVWGSRDVGKIWNQSKPAPKSGKNAKKPTSGGNVALGIGRGPSAHHMPSGVGYGGRDYEMHQDIGYEEHTDDGEETQVEEDGDDGVDDDNDADVQQSSLLTRLLSSKRENDPVSKAQHAQKSEDVSGDIVLGFLTDLLPSLDRETCFDFDPPTAILEMLRNSKILQYCAELLRNDSLADITKRTALYKTLFIFLKTMASHSETSSALFGPRFVRPVDLLTLSFCATATDMRENVAILADCLRNLTTQSAMVIQTAKNNKDFQDEEGKDMLWICRKIADLSDYIKDHTANANDSEKGKETAVVPQYLAVGEVDENLMKQTHSFYKQAKALGSSRPGRFKRLITDITILQTGLPPGIFVRYCENRPDILKCVIVGPLGTPYENGLFEFDFYCGAEYPSRPPYALFKGTAGGYTSINPNLYADGKVCLSLLGTWSGEPWMPGESTLLQVLISIQAMILCEEPWYNEPGREASYTHSPNGPSAKYNRKMRQHTVRTALLAWLDKPPPVWKDIVDQHFKEHGNAILRRVEEWLKEKDPDDGKLRPSAAKTPHMEDLYHYEEALDAALVANGQAPVPQDMGTMLFKLQAALKEYGATFEITYAAPPVDKTAPPATRNRAWRPYPVPSDAATSALQAPMPSVTPELTPSYSFDALDRMSDVIPGFQQHFQGQGPGAIPGYPGFSTGFGTFGNVTYEWAVPSGMPQVQGGSAVGDTSNAPRYETRSTTRGRGNEGSSSSTRGGRGDFTYAPSPSPSSGGFNMGRGRGDMIMGRGDFGRGRGRGGGDAQGGLATVSPPSFSSFANFGRGRGASLLGDGLGNPPPWTRGGGSANGRGGRGYRGGRGRGRGRGDRGGSGN